MGSIRLHPKHGVNPTLTVCWFCRQDTNEIALLGAAYREQAPMRMVLNKQPCDKCKGYMKIGIILVEAYDSGGEPTPCGGYVVMKEEAVRRMLVEPQLSDVLKRRLTYVDQKAWVELGLDAAAKAHERQYPKEAL